MDKIIEKIKSAIDYWETFEGEGQKGIVYGLNLVSEWVNELYAINDKIIGEETTGNKLIMLFDRAENSNIEILGKMVDCIKYKGSYYPDCNLPKFDEDWNLFMPVWVKFRELNYDYPNGIRRDDLKIKHEHYRELILGALEIGSIKMAHRYLTEAITWYNGKMKA